MRLIQNYNVSNSVYKTTTVVNDFVILTLLTVLHVSCIKNFLIVNRLREVVNKVYLEQAFTFNLYNYSTYVLLYESNCKVGGNPE